MKLEYVAPDKFVLELNTAEMMMVLDALIVHWTPKPAESEDTTQT